MVLQLCEGRISFYLRLISRKLCRLLLMFLTGFTSLSVLLLFSSIDHLLCLYARFFILFHLTYMSFSRSAHLLLFISSGTSISSIMAFPPLGNSDHVVISVYFDFPSNSQGGTLFYCIAYDCCCSDWDGLSDHLKDVYGRISLNSVLLLLLVNFVSGLRLVLIYISLIVSIRSSLTHLHGFALFILLP